MIIKRITPYNIHYSQKRYVLMFIGKEKTIPTNLRKHLTLGHYLNVKQRVSKILVCIKIKIKGRIFHIFTLASVEFLAHMGHSLTLTSSKTTNKIIKFYL